MNTFPNSKNSETNNILPTVRQNIRGRFNLVTGISSLFRIYIIIRLFFKPEKGRPPMSLPTDVSDILVLIKGSAMHATLGLQDDDEFQSGSTIR